MGSTPTTSRGRALAFRIVGWLIGAGTILFALAFVLLSLVSDDPVERSHRFHYLASLIGGGLIGLFSILWIVRPDRSAYYHALVGQALAWLIGGLMGGDPVTGFYVTGVIGLVILTVLHPDPRSLFRLPGQPSIALLTYGLLVTIPAWTYAVLNAELQHGSASDPHVQMHHWSGMAVAALSIAAAAIASSLRGVGWEVVATVAAIAATLFGIAGLVFSALLGAPDPTGWSWLAIAAGIGFWLLARIEAAREAPSR
ncbi:MAG: hypothetical protein ACRDG8_10990 [Actinomycetota bacterium]